LELTEKEKEKLQETSQRLTEQNEKLEETCIRFSEEKQKVEENCIITCKHLTEQYEKMEELWRKSDSECKALYEWIKQTGKEKAQIEQNFSKIQAICINSVSVGKLIYAVKTYPGNYRIVINSKDAYHISTDDPRKIIIGEVILIEEKKKEVIIQIDQSLTHLFNE